MTPAISPRDARGYAHINWKATPGEKAAVDQAAAAAGMLRAPWLRERLLQAAGWADGTRRPVPMRPGRQPRPDTTAGNAPVAISVSPREKAAIEKAARKAGAKDLAAWIREVIDLDVSQDASG